MQAPTAKEMESYIFGGSQDEYELGTLDFTPDVIYDIGADVGSVTRCAHKLHPAAKIIAVEPNPFTFPVLAEYAAGIPEVVPVNAAIGIGQMYEPVEAGHLHWLVVGKDAPTWSEKWVPSKVPSLMLDDLYREHGGEQFVVKADCESAEYCLLTHEPSTEIIRQAAYFAAEFHIWARHGKDVPVVANTTMMWLWHLAQTHTIRLKMIGACIHVWARKR